MPSNEYVFCFGYATPGVDTSDPAIDLSESCGVFRIMAEGEAAAFTWGCELATWYVALLYGGDHTHWRMDYYACWIEHQPDEHLVKTLPGYPVVPCGQYPAFEVVRDRFFD